MDKIEELKKLKQLLDDGVISENEFQSLKNEILNNDAETSRVLQDVEKLKLDEVTKNEASYGTLTVRYNGRWFLFDPKTIIKVNGIIHSKHLTKKGFSVNIPIKSQSINLEVTVNNTVLTVYNLNDLKEELNYNLELKFDMQSGGYSNKYKLTENG
jgi:hypothetical protein